jgi:vancomycin resistance protein YoaR
MWAGSVRFTTVFALSALVLLAGGGGGAAARRYWPRSPVALGVTVGERRVPDGIADVAAWLAGQREAARERRVRFRHDGEFFESTLGAAGVSLDDEAALDEVKAIAHEGSVWHRLKEAERARRGEIDVAPQWKIDTSAARAHLAIYAPRLAADPVDAHIDLDKHLRSPDQPGRELDVEASLARLRAGTHEDDEVIELVTRPVSAKVTLGQLTTVNIEKVVSAYETTFSLSGTGAGRAVNIKNAVARFDGTMLAPGQAFSFNDVVGPRTRDRGFALAPEIQGDEMQLGYGGGTCQASTTLYAAALFGAFDILERQSHSRPSHYTQMGLDATVSYPLADLKIRNAMPFPVLIHAFLPNATTVRVEILGGDPVAKVDYVYGVSSTEDFLRRVQVKGDLPEGARVQHQKGIPGFDVTSLVRIHYYDGREDERRYYSGYRPAPEIYWVAPGFDIGKLPPLPEHAKGMELAPNDAARASYEGVGG